MPATGTVWGEDSCERWAWGAELRGLQSPELPPGVWPPWMDRFSWHLSLMHPLRELRLTETLAVHLLCRLPTPHTCVLCRGVTFPHVIRPPLTL